MPVETRKYANADELLDNLTYDGLDLDRPILVGACRCLVNSVVTDMESKSGAPQMVIGLTTEEVCKSTKGEDVQPGFRVTHRINLIVHPNVSAKDYEMVEELNRKEAAAFMAAALGVKYDKSNAPRWKPTEQFVGRSLVVRFDKREDKKNAGTFYQNVKGFNAVS